MSSHLQILSTLRRPRLLVRAARIGIGDYVRDRDLKRAFAGCSVPSAGEVVPELMRREADLEARRVSGYAGYSAARHVHILTVIMAEARRLTEAEQRGAVS